MTTSLLLSSTVLGKRKDHPTGSPVLHLSSPPRLDPPEAHSRQSTQNPSLPLLINGALTPATSRRYKCLFPLCEKAYTKPSRLEEHERSHSGLRPYVCTTCKKSFLRETHLQAHVRSHIAVSERPFVCAEPLCGKRFCTAQHLRRHQHVHMGIRPFACTEQNCTQAFAKHHQLRAHICSEHAPPGTKAYRCLHTGCTQSFATSQKLKAHVKTHDAKRYTCVHSACVQPASSATPSVYFPTWTALQSHMRTAHPPTCPHHPTPRTFASQKGLKAHMKVCERTTDDVAHAINVDEPVARNTASLSAEMEREWACTSNGCLKTFKSERSLALHNSIVHLSLRPHVCPHPGCEEAFGYKHLLERHCIRMHDRETGTDLPGAVGDGEGDDIEIDGIEDGPLSIDAITGKAYAMHAQHQLAHTASSLRCPQHDISIQSAGAGPSSLTLPHTSLPCAYVFTRAYDLHRHLRSQHGIEVERGVVDAWVQAQRH